MEKRLFVVQLPETVEPVQIRQALQGPIADLVIQSWRELAQSDRHTDSGDYLASLTRQSALAYPYLDNPDQVAILSTYFAAGWIEYGRAGFHLPSRWGARGGKWKIGKSGRRYAHVPFEHYSPVGASGSTSSRRRMAMPASVYSGTKNRIGAMDLRTGMRLTGFGDRYKKRRDYVAYRAAGWPNVPPVDEYVWKTSPFEGLFVSSSQATAAAPKHNKYLTIRTITEDSPGWYIPPTPPHNYARRAVDQVDGEIRSILDRAAAADLRAAMESIVGGL